jgi:hypothetical protein
MTKRLLRGNCFGQAHRVENRLSEGFSSARAEMFVNANRSPVWKRVAPLCDRASVTKIFLTTVWLFGKTQPGLNDHSLIHRTPCSNRR